MVVCNQLNHFRYSDVQAVNQHQKSIVKVGLRSSSRKFEVSPGSSSRKSKTPSLRPSTPYPAAATHMLEGLYPRPRRPSPTTSKTSTHMLENLDPHARKPRPTSLQTSTPYRAEVDPQPSTYPTSCRQNPLLLTVDPLSHKGNP
jgi:hypothetical protein